MKFARMCLFLSSVLLTLAAAENPTLIRLWPNGAPGNEPKLESERDTTKESDNKIAGKRLIRLGNVSEPTITVYRPASGKGNGMAVLVCPGGAYHILAMDLEGTEVCEKLNEMGVTAILLKYRVPRRPGQEKHIAPLQDAQRAMALIRQNAEEWKVDPKKVGVLGFSAGGHLAAVLSNEASRIYPKIDPADELNFRPNFTILIYPAYLALENEPTKLSPEIKVGTETPPAFIAMTADDPVRVENALTYGMALRGQKIPFELHIYPTGGHGYGLRKTEDPVTNWPEHLKGWIESLR